MNSDLYNKALKMIEMNQFDNFTKAKVLDYIESHDAMYGSFINTEDVINRIGENLKKSISFKVPNTILKMGTIGGYYSGSKSITMYDRNTGNDVYFHEIDHSATSDLSTMPDFDSDYAWSEEGMNRRWEEGYKYYTGIEITEHAPRKQETVIGKNTNEGITELKERDYAKLKGIPVTEGDYNDNYNMAEQIGYLIGRDNLIQKHFYNDVDGMNEELMKYGINFYEMDELSNKFSGNYDEKTFEILAGSFDIKKGDKFKIEYQNKMTKAFVSKRCQELGITESEYLNLSRRQKKQEFAELQKFEKFKICDCPELNQLKEQIKPVSLMQRVKGLFGNKNKMLPKWSDKNINVNQLLSEKETNLDMDMEVNREVATWNLSRWGIDAEQFREESIQVSGDCLETNQNAIKEPEPENVNTANKDIGIHTHDHNH